jgi:hypothetical protein
MGNKSIGYTIIFLNFLGNGSWRNTRNLENIQTYVMQKFITRSLENCRTNEARILYSLRSYT